MSKRVIHIRPGRQPLREALEELWEYRDLLWLLTVRQISIRYKQTAIGIAWVLLQPLAAMGIFSLIFGRFLKLETNGIPYPIFVYSALVTWTLFAEGLSRSGTSLLADEKLITKVYFPRIIIPLSAVGSAWIDFAISLLVLLPFSYLAGCRPTWHLAFIPLVMLGTMTLSSGIGMVLAALNVKYRDFQYMVPFLIQIWLYASPVVYSSDVVPTEWRSLYYLNPMAGLIELSRFAITGQGEFLLNGVYWSIGGAIVSFMLATMFFRWIERHFADVI